MIPALLGLALLSAPHCLAQTYPQPPALHPHLPALSTFDQKTVQALVDAIDTDHNASTLDYGYFLRRGAPPLPQADGYALVVAALAKEPVASKRWFLLESVRAFAAFRVRTVSTDDGFEAYDAIFNHAADAKQADATSILRQAVVFYVYLVPGHFADLGMLSDTRTGSFLLKAWNVYTTIVPDGKPGLPEPPWAAAIQRAELEKAFLPAIDKSLQTPAVPKTYGLFKTAAIVYQPKDRLKAISLLQQAGPLLPKRADEMGWYYATLTDWLDKAGRLPQAIKATQAGIKSTGHGLGTLATLQVKSGDAVGFHATLMSLSAPDASQAEVNIAGDGLETLYSTDHVKYKAAGDQAISLLSQYLASPRPRDIEQELHAQNTLAGLLIQQNRFGEAKEIIQAIKVSFPLPSETAQAYYYSSQQTLKELNSQSRNPGGDIQK